MKLLHFSICLLPLLILTPVISDAATRERRAPAAFLRTTITNNGPLLDGGASLSPLPSALVAPSVRTNVPLVVDFTPVPQLWFTNFQSAVITNRTITNAVAVWDTNTIATVTGRMPLSRATNYLITLFAGADRTAAFNATGLPSIITNRGPVSFSVSPTNRYVVTLWALAANTDRYFISQADFPSAPSNVVSFMVRGIFSDRLERPEHEWRIGSNYYVLTITNAQDLGTNGYMRAMARAIREDFTPKFVNFGNTIQLFPTNQP